VLLAAGCAEETPTEAGAGLLPDDVLQTFEVLIDPARFLVMETAFGTYTDVADAGFMVMANGYADVLDSRILARFVLPTTIFVRDSTGVSRSDSFPTFFSGEILLVIDSLNSTPAPPVELGLYRNTENWDQFSATWTLRVDTVGVQIPWAVPGGSPGVRVDTSTWAANADTLRLAVDSATLAMWTDTTNAARGAIITAETDGVRLRTSIPLLRVQARSSLNRDTVVSITLTAPQRTFIFQPAPAEVSSAPRVGGTPAWRTFFRMRDRLDTLTVACPSSPTCRVQLGNAVINRATLVLQPVPAPPGFAPEAGLQFAVHLALPVPGVPIERWPVSDALSANATAVPPSSFTTPDAPAVELPVTDLVLGALQRPSADSTFRASHFALLPFNVRTFGFGTFQPLPALRLVITSAKELQLR
jgi:hypothetical protein